jgi:hypothetical protein
LVAYPHDAVVNGKLVLAVVGVKEAGAVVGVGVLEIVAIVAIDEAIEGEGTRRAAPELRQTKWAS